MLKVILAMAKRKPILFSHLLFFNLFQVWSTFQLFVTSLSFSICSTCSAIDPKLGSLIFEAWLGAMQSSVSIYTSQFNVLQCIVVYQTDNQTIFCQIYSSTSSEKLPTASYMLIFTLVLSACITAGLNEYGPQEVSLSLGQRISFIRNVHRPV